MTSNKKALCWAILFNEHDSHVNVLERNINNK
jgi:hypothetical protein